MKLKFGTEEISWLDYPVWDEKTYVYYSQPYFPRDVAKGVQDNIGDEAVINFSDYFLSLDKEEQIKISEGTYESFIESKSSKDFLEIVRKE